MFMTDFYSLGLKVWVSVKGYKNIKEISLIITKRKRFVGLIKRKKEREKNNDV